MHSAFACFVRHHFGAEALAGAQDAAEQLNIPPTAPPIVDGKRLESALGLAAVAVDLDERDIQLEFGAFLVAWMHSRGFDKLLFSLGRSFPDFLRSLNNLFLHVSVDMPGFAAFECHVEQVTASAVRLYCHNVYQLPCIWLEGFLQEVARRLYHLHISIEQDPDVAQEHAKVLIITLPASSGWQMPRSPPSTPKEQAAPRLMGIAPEKFDQMFPYHFVMDLDLRVVQAGPGLQKLVPRLAQQGVSAKDVFQICHPQVPWSVDVLLRMQGTSTRVVVATPSGVQLQGGLYSSQSMMRGADGELTESDEENLFLFMGSPFLYSLDEMKAHGMHLSDFPSNDAAVDIVLMGEQSLLDCERADQAATKLKETVAEVLAVQEEGLGPGSGLSTDSPGNMIMKLLDRLVIEDEVDLHQVVEVRQALLRAGNNVWQPLNLNSTFQGNSEVTRALEGMLGITRQAEHSSDRHSDARRTGQHHSHNHCHSQSQSHKSRSWHDPKQVKQRSPLRLTRWSPTVDSACAHPAPGAVAAAGEDASALVSDVPPPPIDKPQPVMLLPASHQAHQQPLPHEQLQPVSPPSDPPRPADPQQAVARGLVAGGAPNSGFSTIHEGMDDGAATSNSRSHGSQPAQHSVSLALDRQRTLLESVAHATNASNGASSSQALPRTVSPRSATEARSTPVPQPPSLASRIARLFTCATLMPRPADPSTRFQPFYRPPPKQLRDDASHHYDRSLPDGSRRNLDASQHRRSTANPARSNGLGPEDGRVLVPMLRSGFARVSNISQKNGFKTLSCNSMTNGKDSSRTSRSSMPKLRAVTGRRSCSMVGFEETSDSGGHAIIYNSSGALAAAAAAMGGAGSPQPTSPRVRTSWLLKSRRGSQTLPPELAILMNSNSGRHTRITDLMIQSLVAQPPDQLSRVLAGADEWRFDAFKLDEVSNGRPLSCMAFYLIKRMGLIQAVNLNETKLARFLLRIEEGYLQDIYHSRAHAADVLRSLHVLLTRGGVLEAVVGSARLLESPDCSPHSHAEPLTESHMYHTKLLTCYIGAVIHDFEHRGFNNDFLVRSHDRLALLYNDRSPQENHHLAASFLLMVDEPYAFLPSKDQKLRDAMRKDLIELVLATDMKQHFALMGMFSSKVVPTRHELRLSDCDAGVLPELLMTNGSGVANGSSSRALGNVPPRGGSPEPSEAACAGRGVVAPTFGRASLLSRTEKSLRIPPPKSRSTLPTIAPPFVIEPNDSPVAGSCAGSATSGAASGATVPASRPTAIPSVHRIELAVQAKAVAGSAPPGNSTSSCSAAPMVTADGALPSSSFARKSYTHMQEVPRLGRKSVASPRSNVSSGGAADAMFARATCSALMRNSSFRSGPLSGKASSIDLSRAVSQSLLAGPIWDLESQMIVLQMVLKCADLGHLTSSRSVHMQWVKRLEEEMFRQGDAERGLGQPVSPLMDRTKGGITKAQSGFFNVVALPMFSSLAQVFPATNELLDSLKENLDMWRNLEEEAKADDAL